MSKRVTDIILNETDRDLVKLAAPILTTLDPKQRVTFFETIAQAYRDDIAELHIGSDPGALDELTAGFSGALLLARQRVNQDRAEMRPHQAGNVSPNRRRVIEAIERYLRIVKPGH
jgi:hypothetical protein